MEPGTSAKLFHFLVRTSGLALLYIVTAQLGFLAAIPPGNVTVVWPPSGLAVAAVLIYGYRAGLGIWLGSFLINVWSMGGGLTAGAIAASIALGSTAQALAAACLLLRWIGPFPSTPSGKDLVKFVGVTAFTCVIAATIGVTSLRLGGLVNPDRYLFTWATWWLGDGLGIVIITPLLLVIRRWLNREQVTQQVMPIMSGLGVGLGLFLFIIIYSQETQAITAELEVDSEVALAQFKNTIHIAMHDLSTLSALYRASSQVRRHEFQTFMDSDVHGTFATPGIQALEWIPRVPAAQRAAYEAAARRDGLSDFQFVELDKHGQRIPAASRAEYFPVYYVEPLAGNEAALGFDAASEPTRYDIVARARDSGQTLATPPITLIQETGQQKGLVIFQPVYSGGKPNDTVTARRQHLLGFVVGVFRLGDLLTASVDSYHNRAGLDFYLFEGQSLLGLHPAHTRTEPLQINDSLTPASLQSGLFHTENLELLGRRWQLIVQPTPAYINSRRTWTPWAGMGALLTFTGLVIFYIRQRQQAEQTLAESQKQYRLLAQNVSDVIWILDLETMRFRYVSPSVERLRGYTPEQVLGQNLTEVITPASLEYFYKAVPERLNEFKQGHQKYYTDIIENLCRDGTTVWTENTGHFHVNEDNGHVEIYGVARDMTARRQAEAEIRRRNRELALLNQVIAASASGLESEEILNIACRELALAFDVPQVTATVLRLDKITARVVAEYRADGRPSALGVTIPIGRTPSAQYALPINAPLPVNDTHGDARLGALQAKLRESGTTSLLLLPLHINGELAGSLSLESVEPRTFSTEEINLAWSVADQVAGALARGRMAQIQQRLSTVVEQSEQSVIITDTNGEIIYVNPTFERNSGYSQAEVLGQNPRLLKSNHHDNVFYAELWATISTGQVWRGRFVNKMKNGTLHTEDATITPVRDENGAITGYVGLQRDVTQELQMEEQYRQVQKMERLAACQAG
ncbi:MAG: PAS domain S-box protein [Anaerolineales bacterium]|nr:PAS domain S-box protein [Anaerolineales bacterium]